MEFSGNTIRQETERLFKALEEFEYSWEDCERLAPVTLEIHHLKREKNAIILAHSYQTPDIKFGVADSIGDSYGLSLEAKETNADIILFSSVLFMGETAKIINPTKTVLVPCQSGCSLADSVTAEDVRKLRKAYPNAGFVAYINTSAEVKAEVDACCTSANAQKIVENMPQKEVVFLPDKLMGENLRPLVSKKLIIWDGTCIVHEEISALEVKSVQEEYPNASIIAHPECQPEVVQMANFTGSTEEMLHFFASAPEKEFLLLTECGLAERAQKEHPEKKIVGTCHLCPYMKKIRLQHILKALKNPSSNQMIQIPEEIRKRAQKSLEEMFRLHNKDE